jgi:hypothetical protein
VVARVQFAEATNSGVTTLTATLGASTTAGNLLLVMLSVDGGGATPSTVTLTGGSDVFTKDAQVTSTNPIASINLSLWSDPNCSAGHTQVVATSNISAGLLMMVWEVSGAATTSPLAGVPGTAANPANTLQAAFDSTAGASVPAGSFWIGGVTGVGSGGRATPVLAGSWTPETQLQPGSATDMLGGYQAGPGAGTPQFNGTFSAPAAGAYWAAIAAAYKSSSTANTRTASLTATPSRSASATRAATRTSSLLVTPARSAARTAARFRTAALQVTPARSSARVASHSRSASLTVAPVTAALPRHTPANQPVPTGRVIGARFNWQVSGGRVGGN